MPIILPSQPPDVYSDLITLLSPSSPQILEFDILPSSYPPKIHSSPPSAAIPKPLLASLFLTARHVFFSYLTSQGGIDDADKGRVKAETSNFGSEPSSYTAAFQSTLVLLLWDPNHLTAANFRKRHLLSLRDSSSLHDPRPNSLPSLPFLESLAAEMVFLTSLLTSPLPKHTKSPTLWSHRLFLLRTFGGEISCFENVPSNPPSTSAQHSTISLWERELSIILKAAERHPRNYYAWNYARQLLDVLSIACSVEISEGDGESGSTMRKRLAKGSVDVVQKWCLGHPRDISGWAFLECILRAVIARWKRETGEMVQAGFAQEKEDIDAAELVSRVTWETRHFVTKFNWKGASVEWFLSAMGNISL